MFYTLNKLLSGKKASLIVILIAIAARALQSLFYLDLMFDTSFQVIGTQNLINGHGISTAIVTPGNLAAIQYLPQIGWPPGYSLLLTPFYIASGQQYLVACFVLNMLAAISIIIFCRKILRVLDVSLPVINLFTLVTGFYINYFYFIGSTDVIAIAFFLAAIYYSLDAIKTNQKWTHSAVISGCCLLICASLKYLFFPVVFTLPLFIYVYGSHNRSKLIKKAAFISFGIVAAGVATIILYQKYTSGAGTYISSPGRGFFPEHLLRLYPLIPASFLTSNTLSKLPGNLPALIMDIFRVIHVVALGALVIVAARFLFRNGPGKTSLTTSFLLLALFISVTISIVLAFLSLVVDKEIINQDNWWTYIEDARYFGLAEILLQLAVFLLLQQAGKQINKPVKLLFTALPFLLLPEMARGMIFTANRIKNLGKETYYWQRELQFQQYAAKFIQDKKTSLGVTKVVVSGSKYYRNIYTSRHQQLPCLQHWASLNDPASFKTTEPVLLLALIGEDQLELFRPFTTCPGTVLEGKYENYYFYTLSITPR